MTEFAFDCILYAVARVEAATEDEARKKMWDVLNALEINHSSNGVKVTEVSLAQDLPEPSLFEVDGEEQFPPDGMRDK